MSAAPPGGPDALTKATLILAGVTLVVALTPILIRWWDIRRFKKAGRLQLDIILGNVEVRIATLVKHPRYSKRVLLAGIDVLFTRALSNDFADVRPPAQMSKVYAALSSAYQVIVSAVESERDAKETEKGAPFRLTEAEQARFREPVNQLLHNAAEQALQDLGAARAILQGRRRRAWYALGRRKA